jgi:hypothetical protein
LLGVVFEKIYPAGVGETGVDDPSRMPSRAEAFRRLIELGLSAKKTGPKVKT